MQNNFRHASTEDTLNVRRKNLVEQEQVAYVFLSALALGFFGYQRVTLTPLHSPI